MIMLASCFCAPKVIDTMASCSHATAQQPMPMPSAFKQLLCQTPVALPSLRDMLGALCLH